MVVSGDARIIDVREQNEWFEARIPGAELKPMSQINDWYVDLPQDVTLIMQCRSGARSASVVNALISQAGMSNVVNLTGGIIQWDDEDLPVEIGPPAAE